MSTLISVSSQNSQLTTVSVLDPMWVNFSLSENEVERIRGNVRKGLLKPPPDDAWQVEIVLSDGKRFPNVGKETHELVGKGLEVVVCETCCKARGILRGEEIEGTKIGSLTNDLSRFVVEGDRMVTIAR